MTCQFSNFFSAIRQLRLLCCVTEIAGVQLDAGLFAVRAVLSCYILKEQSGILAQEIKLNWVVCSLTYRIYDFDVLELCASLIYPINQSSCKFECTLEAHIGKKKCSKSSLQCGITKIGISSKVA